MPSIHSIVETTAASLYQELQLEKVMVTVRDPRTGTITQFERQRNTPEPRLRHGYTIVSQTIRTGTRTIGQIELHAISLSIRSSQLMEIAEEFEAAIERAVAQSQAAIAA